jgi:cephalosporin hydroxylase
MLDAWAARRTFDALVRATNNVKCVRWLGQPIWQYPLDAWLLQEVISDLRPDLIVETGTYQGGSALFFAGLCTLLGRGRVISIDVDARETVPHPRIEYIAGSSTDPEVVAEVKARKEELGARQVLIVLDSDHSAAHVRKELEAYAPLVSDGSYVHVQDGMLDHLPRWRRLRPGPAVAIRDFLRAHPEFERDLEVERRYVMTAHVSGWLRRRKDAAGLRLREPSAPPRDRAA